MTTSCQHELLGENHQITCYIALTTLNCWKHYTFKPRFFSYTTTTWQSWVGFEQLQNEGDYMQCFQGLLINQNDLSNFSSGLSKYNRNLLLPRSKYTKILLYVDLGIQIEW